MWATTRTKTIELGRQADQHEGERERKREREIESSIYSKPCEHLISRIIQIKQVNKMGSVKPSTQKPNTHTQSKTHTIPHTVSNTHSLKLTPKHDLQQNLVAVRLSF